MLILKILLIALSFLASDGKWIRVNTSEHVSFLFPNTPQKLKQEINGIPSTIYQTKDLVCVAGVVCSDFSVKKIKMTNDIAQALYEELKAGTLSIETAILKNETTVPYENMLIKEIEYSIIKDKHEMTYFKRFIFRDNYIYQISIGGLNRYTETLLKQREIFFNSFTFETEDKTSKNDSNK